MTAARRLLVAACLAIVMALPWHGAMARVIHAFGTNTWQQLQQGHRPAVVVFTTTDCVHCPAVIDTLDRALGHPRSRAQLIVVVMDGAGQDASVGKDPHYRCVDAVYVFDGEEMALRNSVNPEWRGLTPYIAVLPQGGAARFHAGPVGPRELDRLLSGPIKP